MKRSNNWLEGPAGVALAMLAFALVAGGCQQGEVTEPPVALTTQAQDNPLVGFAEACGLDIRCEAGGIAEGKASISGVASVDAFFGSVINFQTKATAVSGAINAELDAIRADFGIAADADFSAELRAQIQANVEGELEVIAEPARCSADVGATLQAQARCDADFDPGSAMVECKGSCEVEASAEVACEGSAELSCTFVPPSGMCEGSCSGTCEVMAEAGIECEGVCKGECDGELEVDTGSASGGGRCNGMCRGSCETQVAAGATCMGSCQGECTITEPQGGCEGAIRAECKAEANAMVMCDGKCEGEFEPPEASVECEASVKAEARMNVECTPPRLAVNYRLKAGVSGDAELEAQARFRAAIENLKVRLPRLLASIKRAEAVGEAGVQLVADAEVAVKGGVDAAISGQTNARIWVGLTCALGELDEVGGAIESGAGKITASLDASTGIVDAFLGA
ncbi:MAG: hypothetical protein OXR73_13125 [Myxococcales bacterium]|nr:hypothetical protein [Myxococcales bacterium]